MSTNLKEIPSPPGWPIVGNLFQIPGGQLTQYLLNIRRDFDGIFQLNFAGRRVPFVYSAKLALNFVIRPAFEK